MSKFKYKNDRRAKNRSIIEVTKAITKKGKIRGKNKKETKALRGMCSHHKINKNGNVKPTLRPASKKYLECSMCGARVLSAHFYDDDVIRELIGALIEVNNQAKFMATGTNAGNRAIDFFASFGVALAMYGKNYKKVRSLADKQSKVKKKKKKSDYRGGSSRYGSWTIKK